MIAGSAKYVCYWSLSLSLSPSPCLSLFHSLSLSLFLSLFRSLSLSFYFSLPLSFSLFLYHTLSVSTSHYPFSIYIFFFFNVLFSELFCLHFHYVFLLLFRFASWSSTKRGVTLYLNYKSHLKSIIFTAVCLFGEERGCHNGTCTGPNQCTCDEGYTGTQCHLEIVRGKKLCIFWSDILCAP